MTNTLDAKRVDFDFDQGADISISTQIYDDNGVVLDITGYHAKIDIRDRAGGELYDSFSDQGGSPEITITGASGLVVLNISHTVSAAYLWTRGVYDLQLTDGSGNISYPYFGDFNLRSRVTQ
jgi:hypothetical protein